MRSLSGRDVRESIADDQLVFRVLQRPRNRQRHLASLFGPYLQGQLQRLHVGGYTFNSLCREAWLLFRFGEHLKSIGIQSPRSIRESHVPLFVQRMRTTETSALGAEATAKRIIERLRKEGVIPSPIPSKADSCGAFIEAFVVFLQQHRGLRSTSLAASRRWARIFADYAGLRSRACIRALGQKQVEGFVIEFLSGVGRGTRVNVTCILRRFLRYLRLAGLTSEELARFVPKVRTYRLQRVPKTLSDREVKNLLKSFDRKTAAGKRNYAMVLLIATYGMRPSDVIRLKLENIDWGHGHISLVQAKTDRPLKLPLLDDVGRAIVDYLKYGRPKTACREIFLAVVAPTAPLEAPSAVTTLVRSYLRKIGIAEPRGGCRALRHTTGKRMIVSGVPLKVIGDTLGHKSTEATYVYTKVDVPALKGVCLDPP